VLDEVSPRTRNRQLVFFLLGAGLLAMTGAIFDSTFANYLDHTFGINVAQRGRLEFPREFPGLAITLLAGALLFLPEVRVAAVAAGCAALGMLGLALFSPTYGSMIGWMVLLSTGTHLVMPVQGAVAVGFANPGRQGKRLGQLGMATTTAGLLACLLVWLILRGYSHNFRTTFLIGMCLAAVAVVPFLIMRPHTPHNPDRPKVVFRRRYWLFFVLCALFGARKQIFLTFGPWVIITIFHKPASTIAFLLFVGRFIGVAFKPLLGRLIDKVGPRVVLMTDAAVLIAVCLGYAFARHVPWPGVALAVLYTCYVLDDILFAAGMARTVYVARLAPNQEEIVGTLAAGVSINHAVSMSVPIFGGMLWMASGKPEPVFLVAAGVMAVTFICALFVRTPTASKPGVSPMANRTD